MQSKLPIILFFVLSITISIVFSGSGSAVSNVFTLGTILDVETSGEIVDKPYLSLYPNPFNPNINISYNLPKDEKGTLNIYTTNGTLIKSFVVSGSNILSWDGKDNLNNLVTSNIYLIQLVTKKRVFTKRIVFLK